jgi:hypothetical protein
MIGEPFGKHTVTDGELKIELITNGEPHCVLCVFEGEGSMGKYRLARIECACGLTFSHNRLIEAAKAWYEHRVFRNQLLSNIKDRIVAKMGEAKP